MGTNEVRQGAVASRVRDNIRRIRVDRHLTGAQLAERLGALGRPMQPTAVNKIETGARRVDVEDIVAIALALNTTPNRLLLNEPADRLAEIELSPQVTASAFQAWAWANGEQTLLAAAAPLGKEDVTFGEGQRDYLRHAQPPPPHPAHEAADELRSGITAFVRLVADYVEETSQLQDADAERDIPLARLTVAAEGLRQGLKHLEAQIGQLVEESPLADQPGYGVAFFASAEVHGQTVSRLNAALAAVEEAQTELADRQGAAAMENTAHAQALHALEMADAGEKDQAQTLRPYEHGLTRADDIVARTRESLVIAEERRTRVERELYGLRRMMLIRNMVPPALPPELAYVDSSHPSQEHAEQIKRLREEVTRSHFARLLARPSR